MNHQTHYQVLPLPSLPFIKSRKYNIETEQLQTIINDLDCKELQEKIQCAMDKIIVTWSDKHDTLVDTLNKLEKTKCKLQHQLLIQSQQLDKSIQQIQLYKSRHDKQRKSISSNRTISSCSTRSSGSIVLRSSILMDGDDDNNDDNEDEFDLQSVMSDSDSFTLPNSPNINTPVLSPILSVTNNENTLLKYACGDGFWNTIARGKANKAEVDNLISNYFRRGGNPNVAKNSDTVKSVKEGYGLIHAVIAVKNTSALHRVLNAGANLEVYPLTINVQDKLTPLLLAAKLGYMNGVKLLIERGGIELLNQTGPYGETCLHAAVQSGSEQVVQYILELNQSLLKETDKNGATCLHYACITGKPRLITLFIKEHKAQTDPKDNKGETPLHYAVRNRKLKVVTKLVGELGVYPNPYILKQVPTPLDLAKSGGLKTIVEYLRKLGAKTTKEMEKRTTTIHSSNSSTFSGESSASGESITTGPSVIGVRKYLHTKTSQILRNTFDL